MRAKKKEFRVGGRVVMGCSHDRVEYEVAICPTCRERFLTCPVCRLNDGEKAKGSSFRRLPFSECDLCPGCVKV
jgi:hypothetical protein